MDVKDAISTRRSIRRYVNKEIPHKVLEQLLEAMQLAPSASNLQRWKVIVVTDADLKRKLVSVSGNQKFVGQCSAYLVGVTEPGAHYSAIDMTIALDHLTLRAVELGLGTCWIGDYETEKVKAILRIPKERDVAICMTLGYPVQNPAARKRKKLPELFRLNGWKGAWR